MEETDAVAIARAQSGDSDAFRCLVERHGRNVFRLAFRMTGNENDAEDIVQETFLRAYKQLNRYESRASFGTWLVPDCGELLAGSDPGPQAPAGGRAFRTARSGTCWMSCESPAPGPDRLAVSRQVQQHVTEAMRELSQQERTAFVLRHFEGLGIEEISGVLGVGGNAAKHTIFRAVQKLRRALEPVVDAS